MEFASYDIGNDFALQHEDRVRLNGIFVLYS